MRVINASRWLLLSIVAIACQSDREMTAPPSSQTVSDQAFRQFHKRVLVQSVACGATILADLRLEHDLTCPGDAITVGANDVTIDLNGHAITGPGPGSGIGITVRQRSGVSIKGGTISGFATGIMVAQSTGVVIKDGHFTQTREAVFFAGTTGSVVKANVMWQNVLRGVMLRPTGSGLVSTDNQVMDNEITDTPSGILVFGQPGNTLKGNTISGSTVGAIDLTGGGASGNVIKENILTASAAGIKFGAGWVGNDIRGNTIHANTCGFLGSSAGNELTGNVFTSNTVDLCP